MAPKTLKDILYPQRFDKITVTHDKEYLISQIKYPLVFYNDANIHLECIQIIADCGGFSDKFEIEKFEDKLVQMKPKQFDWMFKLCPDLFRLDCICWKLYKYFKSFKSYELFRSQIGNECYLLDHIKHAYCYPSDQDQNEQIVQARELIMKETNFLSNNHIEPTDSQRTAANQTIDELDCFIFKAKKMIKNETL